jgi:hypothetical protein
MHEAKPGRTKTSRDFKTPLSTMDSTTRQDTRKENNISQLDLLPDLCRIPPSSTEVLLTHFPGQTLSKAIQQQYCLSPEASLPGRKADKGLAKRWLGRIPGQRQGGTW